MLARRDQKLTKAQVADGEFVMKKEIVFQEKEREVEENAKAKAVKGQNKGVK